MNITKDDFETIAELAFALDGTIMELLLEGKLDTRFEPEQMLINFSTQLMRTIYDLGYQPDERSK